MATRAIIKNMILQNINNFHQTQMSGILEALNPNKEVFGLSGQEEVLANKEAEQSGVLPYWSEDETEMDFSGAGGPDDDR